MPTILTVKRIIRLRVMEFCRCSNCNKETGHKRALGWGTCFAFLLTGGLWLLAIPFYPKRCIVCGCEGDGRIKLTRKVTTKDPNLIWEKRKVNPASNKTIKNLAFVFTVLLVLSLLSQMFSQDTQLVTPTKMLPDRNVGSSSLNSNFMIAMDGEYWIILDDNIAICKTPKISLNEAQFKRNLITIIGNNTKVEIIKSKGASWKFVYAYKDQDIIYAKGWILAETVKKAKLIK